MKILFLDIDSVLNNIDTMDRYVFENGKDVRVFSYAPLDFVCVHMLARLHRIIKETDCKIVGISSWFSNRKPERTDRIAEFLGIEIIGITDYTGGGMARAKSVARWLKSNDVSNYVILDDIPDFSDYSDEMRLRHVQPIRFGLTDELADNAIRILNCV